MYNSEAFRELTGNDIRLYMNMLSVFYKNMENDTDFEYSQNYGIKVLHLSENSGKSIRRSLNNLVKYGFIERTLFSKGGGKNNKTPNRFKFSENWKDYRAENGK